MCRLIIDLTRRAYSSVEAVYLYGSFTGEWTHESSDVDLGILLPHTLARDVGALAFSDLRSTLERELHRDVDLVNLRLSSIVLQKEIVATSELLYVGDDAARAVYEMLVLSLYGKLNEERAGILEEFKRTRRAYQV
jgi:uncharacterized protein